MPKNTLAAACPACAAKTQPDSQFCPQCGTRLGDGETLELHPEPIVPDASLAPRAAPADLPPAVHQAHRRPLGIHPVPLLGGLGALGLLLAVILLAAGSLVAGLILLGITVALFTLFSAGVRREPDVPAARLAIRTASRISALAGLIAVAVRAWARAGLALIRIRVRQQRLRGRLKANLAPLGEAVHRDDERRAQALKRQAAELEQKLDETSREASNVIAGARREIQGERATIAPTEPLAPDPADES